MSFSRAVMMFMLTLLLVFAVSACSGSSKGGQSPLEPGDGLYGEDESMDSLPLIALAGDEDLLSGIGILGIYELCIDSQNGTTELIAKRSPMLGESFIVSAISFFTMFPCFDCLTIKGFSYDGENIILIFHIRHPYQKGNLSMPPSANNRLDLDMFDVALIIHPTSKSPIHFDLAGQDIYHGVVSNVDGYTTELSYVINNRVAMPYVLVVDDSESVPPSSTFNRFEMGAEKDFEVKFKVAEGERLFFDLYLTWGYGVSAKPKQRLKPQYFNPEFNRKAAWKVEVIPPNGNDPPQEGNTWDDGDSATPYNVTVKVWDWQIGANVNPNLDLPTDIRENSDVAYVRVEIPGMNTSPPEVSGDEHAPGGKGTPDNPLVFTIPIHNENLIPAGEYVSLVKVADKRSPKKPSTKYDYLIHSPDGKKLNEYSMPEYATYKTFIVTVVSSIQYPIDVTPQWLNFSPNDVYVEGNYAYVAGYVNGLHIFEISNPSNPIWVNWVDTPYSAIGVHVTSGYAYVADGEAGLQIIDIEPPSSAYIVKTIDTPGSVWGVHVTNGYAYVADWFEFLIIDIDPISSAYIVKTIDTPGEAVGVYVSSEYAYVADRNAGLQIIDIDPPESAYIVKTVDTPDSARSVHISGMNAYVADNYSGLQIIDIDPPESAYIVKTVDTPGRAQGVHVSGSYAYVADSEAGLQIIDIEPPESSYIVNTVDTMGSLCAVHTSGEYAYVTDELTALHIIDIEPTSSAYIIKTIDTPSPAYSVHVSGEYAYVTRGVAGIGIIDINPPESVHFVKTVDTPSGAEDVHVSGEYAYITDYTAGLMIIDIDPPESAYVVKTVDTQDYAERVHVSGGYAYVTDGNAGLQIIDIDPPESAYIVNTVDTPDTANCVHVSGGYAYVGSGVYDTEALLIIDIDPPESAYIENTVDTPGYTNDIYVSDGYAYVADWLGFLIIDIDPPESAYILKTIDTPGYAADVYISGGYAYVADYDAGLTIIDIEPLDSAYVMTSVNTPASSDRVYVSGQYAYLGTFGGGLRIIKLW